MKKIVLLSLFALCLPLLVMAQSNNDDLYFVPSKEKKQEAKKTPVKKEPEKKVVTTNIYTSPGTTVVVQDRKGNKRDMRDVDEYNRRYDAKDNEFAMEDDTLYVKEKAVSDPEGEWVNGFNGSQDDYEYAERIIRFRNPRFAVSISSPLYWDIVYGTNSWDWTVSMLMHSRHLPTAYGGIGVTTLMVPDGAGDGAGLHLIMLGVAIIPVIGVAIGVVTGAAGMAAATGDTIITIIPDGVAEDIIGRVIILIPTAVLMVLLVLAPLPE